MLLIEANYEGKILKLIAQNAETIRVVTPKGSKSVTELKKGDKILAHVKEGGRHFGTLVKEEAVIER
jgi:3-dehydroquinate synthase II